LSQASFYSVNDFRLHFGLGDADTADLEILWPSGKKEILVQVASDQLVTVREGSGIVNRHRVQNK
jgi:enediyne biosynthesis protein E4